jgi:hypothetical protein
MENTTALLSTAYFAPIQYYCKLIQHSNVMIEQWENYSKQSYRNRCNIYGANGALAISVPVVKATSKKVLIKDVKISYDTNWQKLHWKGIESAYKSSPFYEYYIDDLERFFSNKWEYLLDFNQEIQAELCEILEIENKNTLTDDFIPLNTTDFSDFRNVIHPKISKETKDPEFNPKPYTQVFGDKHGFIPNVSILDLIFNMGPDSSHYLETCLK